MTTPTILIAEDETIVALDIRKTVEKLGYPVVNIVSTGEQAINSAVDLQPDLALMDIMLEGEIDGVAAAEKIQRDVGVPVVFLTAFSDDATLERAKVANPYGFLIKPFSKRELKSIIEIALYKHKMQTEVEDHKRWLTTILQNIGEAVIAVDSEKKIRFINPVAAKNIGIARQKALGCDLDEVLKTFDPKSGDPVKFTPASFTKDNAIAFDNLLLKAIDGGGSPIEYSATAIKNKLGRFDGCVIVFQDISNRLREEERRQKMEAQLQISQKMESLGALAGGVAHDFNNLLTGILGNVGLAQLDLTDQSPIQDTIEQIENAALRAAELCKQMLAYAGRSQFAIEPVSLNDVIREMSPLLRVSVSKKAMIKYRLSDSVPAIEADAAQLRQVIMNLAINAADAISGNKGEIEISTGAAFCEKDDLRENILGDKSLPGEYVFLEIKDSGQGMHPSVQERIFEPFFTTKFLGRGLGLAAVLGIIRGHRGMIHIHSQQDVGTTFKIFLPQAHNEQIKQAPRVEEFGEWRDSGTVLIVDDEEAALNVGRKILERIGYETLIAENGRDAVEVFKERKGEVKLVLLDVTMPIMNGGETLEALREIRDDVKVILSSGYHEQAATEKIDVEKLAGFIHKPYLPMQMISKVRDVMMKSSQL